MKKIPAAALAFGAVGFPDDNAPLDHGKKLDNGGSDPRCNRAALVS